MNAGTIRLAIIVSQFGFKPMMFQMIQAISQYSSAAIDDPHIQLRQFMEVSSNLKIYGVRNDAFRFKLFPYTL